MATHSQNALLLPLLMTILLIFPNGGAAMIPAKYEPIDNPDDPHIQALAMFAVRQHNKESGETLSLTRVLGGQQLVMKGSDYRLVIGADGNSGAEDLYLAVVYENAWMHYRDLTAFNIIA
ncbi:unnamed protein product [Spirodela intermedia]|uniref:Cystatin domain-containing protein n=1 Tax=Spirodela intermedia TaxID=51605 RepID=A0A7I8KQG2_SPIIN|nr:unnamed protein product [Spirodela intermedia]